MNEIKILIPIVIATLGSFMLCSINLKKDIRYKQGMIPIIMLVYSIVAIVLVLAGAEKISELIKEAESGSGNQYLSIFLLNSVVLIVAILIKVVVIVIMKNSKNMESWSWVSNFYEYDADYRAYFLSPKWIDVRTIFYASMIIYTVITGIFLGLTWIYGEKSGIWLYFFPVILQLVVVEIYNFLNGYAKTEFSHSVSGEESKAQHVSMYFHIKNIYRAIFGPEILFEKAGIDYVDQAGIQDFLIKLKNSEDDVEHITAEFFSLSEGELSYDTDYIQATLKLMKHENVIFFNPFYRDLSQYMVLPLINTLLANEKCLVIVGRNSAKEDVRKWLQEMIHDYCKVDYIWRVDTLNDQMSDNCEVGILGFHELYDLRTINKNKRFFNETGFVFILEPSLVINTGQIGFSILAEHMRRQGISPVYCIIDRIVDGLVDTMSHLLHEEIKEVIAPPVPRLWHTSMAWNVDGDYMRQKLFHKQTRYLGNGMELAAVAVKNQIPEVSWISESKAPMLDLKWIVGQYYTTFCKFMNLPMQQQSIYEKIKFSSNIWKLKREKEQFIIVDDEFCNIFSMMRTFMSRGEEQVFINILAENYLLRDYMRCNNEMFESNPNAVPSIVPDYAKTERNTILKLLFIMAYRPMKEKEIRKELDFAGCKSEDVYHALTALVKKYTYADEKVFAIHTRNVTGQLNSVESEFEYSISIGTFHKYLARSLSNAYYIVENENKGIEYIDAKLFGHVVQTILPGQFVVYEGKYYLVKSISVDNGVLLRRASNLYDSRKYYRQIRKYCMDRLKEIKLVSARKIMDVEIKIVCMDFYVDTTGYLEMNSNNDLRNARIVELNTETTDCNLQRRYKSKNVLQIYLPDTDNKMRFTICLLLSEMFRTIFPSTWQYLAAVSVRPDDIDGMLNYTVYELDGNAEDEYIYILEDSDVDLGLLESIDKNFMRLMELLADFIVWHFEKMREIPSKDPIPQSIVMPPDEEIEKDEKGIAEYLKKLKKVFSKKEKKVSIEEETKIKPKDEKPEEQSDIKEEVAEEGYSFEDEETLEGELKEPEEAEVEVAKVSQSISKHQDENHSYEEDEVEENAEEDPDIVTVDEIDIFDMDNSSYDENEEYFNEIFDSMGLNRKDTKYQKECYLKYGFDDIDQRIKLVEVAKYLNTRGWMDNALTKARKRNSLDDIDMHMRAINYCDFCGRPLSGVSYDVLSDGRTRCNDCSATAITTIEEFEKIFYHSLSTMEMFFNIDYKEAINVQTADADVIAKGTGAVFTPSTKLSSRVLGYAQQNKGGYRLLVENGSPRLATINTMIHEMTHIWQYIHWDDKKIVSLYGNNKNRLIVYEGMAMWTAIQYLYLIGETSYARMQEQITLGREDEYGIGFKLYCRKYPLKKESASSITYSPFNTFPPL